MTSSTSVPVRTYGNWRRARGMGIGQLTGAQTATLFGSVLVPVLCAYVSARAAALTAVVSVVVVLAVVVRVDGRSAADALTRRMRFRRAAAAGWLELSGGVLTDHPRKADLPGPMAPLVPLECDDGRGGRQGLLWDRRTGYVTAIIRVSPVGLGLADREQADVWVANFGGFLADLGYQSIVRHIAITVDSSPAGGATLRDYIAERIDPRAPAAAREVMQQLVEASPASVADVETHVAVTFDPARANPRPDDLLGLVAEVTCHLPGIETTLSAVGVSVLGRASVEWITGRLRVAYDPAARADVARARPGGEVIAWQDAGPMRARETWEQWEHDSGVSIAWAMAEAPRQAVLDRVLTPLLAPGTFPRRVTLLYEPFAASDAASEVEREITNASVRRAWAARTRRDETQRDRADQARALQAAREEAEGAGVGKFCLYVSTTVTDSDRLPAAAADIEQRAGQSKLRLRRMRGAHAGGFAAALGMGLNPTDLARRSHR